MNDSLFRWLSNRGFTGSLEDMQKQYLLSVITNQWLDARLFQFPEDIGYWRPSGAGTATLTADPGGVILAGTGADPFMFTNPNQSIIGSQYYKIRVKITRLSGADWDGTAYYATANHNVSNSFRKVLPDPPLVIGVQQTLIWDMSTLTVGGTDWLDSTIIQLRLDFGLLAGNDFLIEEISVGIDGAQGFYGYSVNDLWRAYGLQQGYGLELQEIQKNWAIAQGATSTLTWNDAMGTLPP